MLAPWIGLSLQSHLATTKVDGTSDYLTPQTTQTIGDMFWAKVPQNRTFCLMYLVCCRHTCWFAQRCFAMCRHTLVAQHFCPFSVFDIFWPFVAKPNVLFFNGIFSIFPYPSHLPCCGPKPQTTAKLAPHNVVAQRFDWFCHLCAWARCAGAARWDTRGETAVECAKCLTSQIWGPNQVPCNGRWKAPWCLAMCWWPNRLTWWFASFRALVAKGGPFYVCKCGAPAGLVSKNAQTPPKVNQNGPTGRRECQTSPLFSKNGPKKTLCSCLRPLWQAPLGNVPISCNLAQNLSCVLNAKKKPLILAFFGVRRVAKLNA